MAMLIKSLCLIRTVSSVVGHSVSCGGQAGTCVWGAGSDVFLRLCVGNFSRQVSHLSVQTSQDFADNHGIKNKTEEREEKASGMIELMGWERQGGHQLLFRTLWTYVGVSSHVQMWTFQKVPSRKPSLLFQQSQEAQKACLLWGR